ncbi:MAG TPA: SRPBCC family protein [Rhizobacter sp.]
MYPLADTSIAIACSAGHAFDYAANLENFPQWFPGAIAITSSDGLPFAAVGKQYRETVAVPWRGTRQVSIRVTEAEPSRRLVTEGSLAPLLPRMEIEFMALGADDCRVTWRMLSRNTRIGPRWTLLPLARRVMTKRAATAMRQLKDRLEGRSVPS